MEQILAHSQKDLQLFARPLIIGASISKGYGTRDGGLGAVLARSINPRAEITNLAISGATSLQSTAHLNFGAYQPSIVLGLDLFFWDGVRGQVGAQFQRNTRRLFKHFHDRNIPMIVGKIPTLDLPFNFITQTMKNNIAQVNALLEELCTLDKNCLLYDPLDCLMKMDSGDYFSDSLHLNSEGNKFCARFLVESGVHKQLSTVSG